MLKMLKNLNLSAIQIWALGFIALFYAVLGQPTPDKISFVEILIGFLLIFCVGITNFFKYLSGKYLFIKESSNFQKIGSLGLIYFLTIPTIISIFKGQNLNNIIRDIIPLLYIFLPLFMISKIKDKSKYIYFACISAGLIFSIRFLMISNFNWLLLGQTDFQDNYMYLSIAPFVLFSTLACLIYALNNPKLLPFFIIYIFINISAMIATFQRATIGLFFIFSFLILIKRFYKQKILLLITFLGIIGFYLIFKDYIDIAVLLLIKKSLAVGSNSRIAEFTQVINEIKNSLFTNLFGQGWGYKFNPPTIEGYQKVGFTHCSISYFLLKTGFIGMCLYLTYIANIFYTAIKNKTIFFNDYLLTIIPSLLIAIFLYTGYKYLDFGYLLLLMLSFSNQKQPSIGEKKQEIIKSFKNFKIENPTLDANIILQKVLNKSKSYLVINHEEKINFYKNLEIDKLVKQRANGKPIDRILGEKEFYSLTFKLNKGCLSPRPDSECIIDAILKEYKNKDNFKILDLGTGSGCLILTLLHEFTKQNKTVSGTGADLSKLALMQAKRNAKNLKIKNIKFIHSNWTSHLHKKFDIVVCNPPYVRYDENLSVEVKKHDPNRALFAHENGLSDYKKIASQINKVLNPQAKVFLEIGKGQEKDVACIFEKNNLKLVNQYKDLKGIIRCLEFTN
jgi:release factor glutamine methyltransferase